MYEVLYDCDCDWEFDRGDVCDCVDEYDLSNDPPLVAPERPTGRAGEHEGREGGTGASAWVGVGRYGGRRIFSDVRVEW